MTIDAPDSTENPAAYGRWLAEQSASAAAHQLEVTLHNIAIACGEAEQPKRPPLLKLIQGGRE